MPCGFGQIIPTPGSCFADEEFMLNVKVSKRSMDEKSSFTIHLIPKAWNKHGVEALWTGQKNILLSCPQCLDSMLAPGFWNKMYKAADAT